MLAVVRTISEILAAGVSITAFSLLIYALSFNLRDRVARTFALIMICVVIIFSAESIGGITTQAWETGLWLRVQWLGIAVLPAIYLHFSDAVLATTGKPSRGRRRWAVRLSYLASGVFLLLLPISWIENENLRDLQPAPHLQPTLVTDIFVLFYFAVMLVAWVNLVRGYVRTTTKTSRRRLFYLALSSLGPMIGSFPFLPFGTTFFAEHPLIFWVASLIANLLNGILLVMMAYSVAFFGVAWPDRVVKARLLKWIMRGPFTASLTLAAVTLVRRTGEAVGFSNYNAFVPIIMVATILVCEHLITLLTPFAERVLFMGNDRADLELLRRLESQLVTRNDLTQFLEMVLAAAADRMQAQGTYVIALHPSGSELVITNGRTRFDQLNGEPTLPQELFQEPSFADGNRHIFHWGADLLLPLMNGTPENPELIGLLGVSGVKEFSEGEQTQALFLLADRAALALRDRRIQQKVFQSLDELSSQVGLLQRLRAAGRYDRRGLLAEDEASQEENEMTRWVKEALAHYWGGPKLTGSPLMNLQIVRDATAEMDGNQANALRAILKKAIEQTKPAGERRFTGEWILYNILDMKFLEGKKVREIAMRLAMSEADLYRKQRVAIEAVAKIISSMEEGIRKNA